LRKPGLTVVLLTRARVRIVKQWLEKTPPHVILPPPDCGLQCPSVNEMAEYIDRRLAGPRQAEIDEHLCSCASCFAVYEGVLRFQLEQEKA
jgi:hypothetical protein